MIPRWTKNWNSKDTWWPSQGCPLCFDQRATQGEAWSPAEDWLKVSNLAQITWLDPHLHTAPDKEQLPGTHFRDIFHHYIAGERWVQKTTTSNKNTLTWSTALQAQRSKIQGTQMVPERRLVDLKLLDARRRKTLRRSRGTSMSFGRKMSYQRRNHILNVNTGE